MEKPNIYTKLLDFQKLGISVKKDSQNPHFKNKYADINEVLEKVKKPLNDMGILVMQTPVENGLETCLYDTESDTYIKGFLEYTQKSDAQKVGSNITYNRRYSLIAMLGLEDDDDDAEGAVDRTSQPDALPTLRR